VIAHLPHDAPDQSGLAEAGFAVLQPKRRLLFQSVLEHGHRHRVLPGWKQICGVRRQRERLGLQTKVSLIHRESQ